MLPARRAESEDILWDPSAVQMPAGALLPHMRLPPAQRSGLETLGPCTWNRRLTVPPDGRCMLYAFLAACDPTAWNEVPRSEMGFIEDVDAERGYKKAAENILDFIVLTMRSKEMDEIADRLAAGGHPGRKWLMED